MKRRKIKVQVKKYAYLLIISIFIISIFIKIFPRNYTEFTAIDVGQGDSFLFVTGAGKRVLIDGGGSETTDYDVGRNILMPYLLDRGFMKIDYVFISHAHADHIDGIYTILENFKVNTVFIGPQLENDKMIEKLREIAAKRKVKIIELYEGDVINIDELKFEILYPSKSYKDSNINNLSLIIKVNCNGKSILFTGDAEEKVEEFLLNKYDVGVLDVDILKVGHHGAKTSSSEEFIKIVSPAISIVSVSKDNTYGHPNEGVIKRLERYGKVLKTSDCGEINIKIYSKGKVKLKLMINK